MRSGRLSFLCLLCVLFFCYCNNQDHKNSSRSTSAGNTISSVDSSASKSSAGKITMHDVSLDTDDELLPCLIYNKYEGRLVYVDVWATACYGCIEEIPYSKSLQQNIEERIVSRLGLEHTYLEKRSDVDVSRGYNFSGQVLKDVTIWDRADSDGDPAAGVISTARDLLLFGEALFTGHLVSDTSLARMKVTKSFPSCGGDCGYGLGIETWYTATNAGYGKNGSSIGVDANLIYFPDQRTTMVIFSNFGGGNDKSVIDALLSIE